LFDFSLFFVLFPIVEPYRIRESIIGVGKLGENIVSLFFTLFCLLLVGVILEGSLAVRFFDLVFGSIPLDTKNHVGVLAFVHGCV